jgi:peptidoglycan/xylan/chitin deacetylase (PgdA/CDA1 family)
MNLRIAARSARSRIVRGWLPRALGVPVARAVELALRWTPLEAGVALVYHRVEANPGIAESHLAACHGTRLFRAQLRHLRRCHRVVCARDLPAAIARRRRGQPFPVAVTFDDDLRSHVEVALPELRAVGLKATFFVCGASLDEAFSFWWERLQTAYEAGVPMERYAPAAGDDELGPGSPRHHALHAAASEIERLTPSERDRVAARLEQDFPEPPAWSGLGRSDVRRLGAEKHEVGFHTKRHDLLRTLDDLQLEQALVDGRDDVAEAAGAPVTSFAYPHGKAGPREAAAVRAAGYGLAFTSGGAGVGPDTDRWLMGRIEPSFISRGHLALQMARALVRAGADDRLRRRRGGGR